MVASWYSTGKKEGVDIHEVVLRLKISWKQERAPKEVVSRRSSLDIRRAVNVEDESLKVIVRRDVRRDRGVVLEVQSLEPKHAIKIVVEGKSVSRREQIIRPGTKVYVRAGTNGLLREGVIHYTFEKECVLTKTG